MRKSIWSIVLIMVIILSVGGLGCAEPAPAPTPTPTTPTPTPAPPAGYEWPEVLLTSSMAVGSLAHAAKSSWTPIMSEDTGMKFRILPEDNSTITARWLKDGTTDLASHSLSSHAATHFEATGEGATKLGGPTDVRFVWEMMEASWGVMVRGDSDIETIYDLKAGHKVANFPIPAYQAFIKGVCAWAGVDSEEIIWVNVSSFVGGVRAVSEGRADFTYIGPFFGDVFEAAAGAHGVRFLDMDPKADPEGAARFSEFRPTLFFGVNEGGVKEAIGVNMMVAPSGFLGKADMDPELVYNFVKWINEHYDEIKDLHPSNKYLHVDYTRGLLDTTYIPVHDGTIKYMKELGMWTDEDDRRQAYNLDLLNKYITAYQEAITKAEAAGIKVDPQNEDWMTLWTDYKKKLELPGFRVILKH